MRSNDHLNNDEKAMREVDEVLKKLERKNLNNGEKAIREANSWVNKVTKRITKISIISVAIYYIILLIFTSLYWHRSELKEKMIGMPESASLIFEDILVTFFLFIVIFFYHFLIVSVIICPLSSSSFSLIKFEMSLGTKIVSLLILLSVPVSFEPKFLLFIAPPIIIGMIIRKFYDIYK